MKILHSLRRNYRNMNQTLRADILWLSTLSVFLGCVYTSQVI